MDNLELFALVKAGKGGGQQPTLFAPLITSGLNTVSWANDTRNGGFSTTITATVDGNTVTSPLTITQALDGKTLAVEASAQNFESGTSTAVLSYISQPLSVLNFTNYSPSSSYPDTFLYIYSGSTIQAEYEDTSANLNVRCFLRDNLQGQKTVNLLLKSDATRTTNLGFGFTRDNAPLRPTFWGDEQGLVGNRVNFTGEIQILCDGSIVASNTALSTKEELSINNVTIEAGKLYSLIMNITF